MPSRNTPLVNGQIYHVFNRSIDEKPIFIGKKLLQQAYETIAFYRFKNSPVRLSHFNSWSKERKKQLFEKFEKQQNTLIEIICYCFMPNHFHLLLKQKQKQGISIFLSLFQNSFTRYFNTFSKRKGHLFAGQFKAVRIETEEQLLHVSRYIHLNPYSSFVIKNMDDLLNYELSSFGEYIGKTKGFCSKDIILSSFKNQKNYQNFVYNQADYQRNLEQIKHLLLEKY